MGNEINQMVRIGNDSPGTSDASDEILSRLDSDLNGVADLLQKAPAGEQWLFAGRTRVVEALLVGHCTIS